MSRALPRRRVKCGRETITLFPISTIRYRFDKPPLTYWTQVASYKIFGESDYAARFPSTIAAALTAVCIFGWGSRVGGKRLGWIAAIIFTLSLQTFIHAKAAVADMWLVLFVTLAHWSGYELLRASSTGAENPTPNPPSQGYGAAGVQRPTSNAQWLWWWNLLLCHWPSRFWLKGRSGGIPSRPNICVCSSDNCARRSNQLLQSRNTFSPNPGLAIDSIRVSNNHEANLIKSRF